MFLLLLHLLQNRFLLDFHQSAAIFFAQTQPKLFDPLAFFGGVGAPNPAIRIVGWVVCDALSLSTTTVSLRGSPRLPTDTRI